MSASLASVGRVWRCVFSRPFATLVFAFAALAPVHAFASSTVWIESNAQADGSIATASEPATGFQATFEAIRALDGQASSVRTAASNYILSVPASTTESVAAQAIVAVMAGKDASVFIDGLVALQNSDGGFGETTGYQSTALDTANALEAFAAANATTIDAASRAIQYLVSTQNADGSYRLPTSASDSVYVTACALRALSRYRVQYDTNGAIAGASTYLDENQEASGGWGSTWQTAVALLALAPVTTDITKLMPASSMLAATQQTDGSWDGSVYATALAARAQNALANIPQPPISDVGVVSGRVIDSATGQPIYAAVASIAGGVQSSSTADGFFKLAGLSAGTYSFHISASGYNYVDVAVNVGSGGTASLGDILLTPQPNTGVIRGVVTNAATGLPIAGALVSVSGTTNASTQTDETGNFVLIVAPGSISISVAATGYQSAVGIGSLLTGSTLWYSPTLVETGETQAASGVTFAGTVVDDATGQAMAGVAISVGGTAGQWNATTDVSGHFSLAGVTAGDERISFAKAGYRTTTFDTLSNDGQTFNLGVIRLQTITTQTSTTLSGHVVDADTNEPVPGAEVDLQELAKSAVAAIDGSYRIDGVNLTKFTVTSSAPGYASAIMTVSLPQYGATNVDIALHRVATDIDLSAVRTDASSYPALTKVYITATLANKSSVSHSVYLQVGILDSTGATVDHFAAVHIPLGGSIEDGWVTVDANAEVDQSIEWNTDRHVAGQYRIVIEAFDTSDGQLLAQRGTTVNIESTQSFGGSAAFEPPIAQLAANRPISITALLANRGNEPIGPVSATASVTLQQAGYDPQSDLVDISSIASGTELTYASGLAVDGSGTLYTGDPNSNRILGISTSGSIAPVGGAVGSPTDIDVAGSEVYSLRADGTVDVSDSNGGSRIIVTGIQDALSIKVRGDGRIVVGARSGIYEVAVDGAVKNLSGVGLADPRGLGELSNGDIIIANSAQNSLMRYSGGKLLPFVANINKPYGLVVDSSDNIYVTSFGSNTLYRITPDGTATVLATGLGGPYDVKLRSDGMAVVSNYNTSTIDVIGANGNTTQVAGPTINAPTAAVYNGAGTLFVANNGFGNVVSMTQDGSASEFVSGVYNVKDMVLTPDGGMDILEANGTILHASGQGGNATVVADSQVNGGALALSGEGDWLVADTSGNQVVRVSAGGGGTPYISRSLGSPIVSRVGPNGSLYVLSSEGYVTRIDPDNSVSVVASGLSSPHGLALDAQGDLYTSETSLKRIVKITPSGEISRISVSFQPGAVAVAPDGLLYAAIWNSTTINRLDQSGTWSKFKQISYYILNEMTFDTDGALWVAHSPYGRVTRVNSDGTSNVFNLSAAYCVNSIVPDGSGGAYATACGGIDHIEGSGVVTKVLSNTVLSNKYLEGVVRAQNGEFTTIDQYGRLARFDVSGDLVARYSSVAAPTGLANTSRGLFVAGNDVVLLFAEPGKLGQIVAGGAYQRLAVDADGSLLAATTATVTRISQDFTTSTTLASGYSNIMGLAASPLSGFAVADYDTNRLTTRGPNGAVATDFYGLVKPKGILVNANGDLLVANGNPVGLMKVGTYGRLSMVTKLNDADQLLQMPDGTILVGNDGHITVLTHGGTSVYMNPTVETPQGILRTKKGLLYTTTAAGSLKQVDSAWNEHEVASGVAEPRDIVFDGKGTVVVADGSRGVVNRVNDDGSIELAQSGVSNATALAYDADGTLYVAYGTGQLAKFTSDGRRIGLLVPNNLGMITGLRATSAGGLYGLVPTQGRVVRLRVASAGSIETGGVVYTHTVSLDGLPLDGKSVSADFGAWTPTRAGDYLVEVKLADGATSGVVTNTLHVGPNASATLALAQSSVRPGDSPVGGQLTVIGADNTSITQIDPNGATLTGASYTARGGLAADPEGNIYVADYQRIVKMAPDGTRSDFITNIGVDAYTSMASDSNGFVYFIGSGKIHKVAQDGTISATYTAPGTAKAIAVGYDDALYAVTTSNVLVKIDGSGGVDTIATIGINGPKGLSIDGYGNFYVENYDNSIARISPDGASSAVIFNRATFENEGVNIMADCSNNVLIATANLAPFTSNDGEERKIIQISGDTGDARLVLDGPAVDKSLLDIDNLYYDRFGRRMLIWTDNSNGKVYSFPLSCGGIDAAAHVMTRSDVDLSSTDPAPDQVITHADGAMEYVWALHNIDYRGRTIDMNMLFRGMAEGEHRQMFGEAYLTYGNSFVSGESVRVPIAIPGLVADSAMKVTPVLSSGAYGPDSFVQITAQVDNGGNTAFNGSVVFSIVDGANEPVANLDVVSISELAGNTNGSYTARWYTGSTMAGNYSVRAELINSSGINVASGTTPFSIVTGAAAGTSAVGVSAAADRAVYKAWDAATVSITVVNTATNADAGPGSVALLVTDPVGVPIKSAVFPMLELSPGGRTSFTSTVPLVDALAGDYSVSIVVQNAATGGVLAVGGTTFAVERTADQAVSGTVKVQTVNVLSGDDEACSETVKNRGSDPLTGVKVYHRLVNMDTGDVVNETSRVVDLAGGQSIKNTESVGTAGLVPGGYACQLTAEIAGTSKNLAQDSFVVKVPPIKIGSAIELGTRGRVLVLLDSTDGTTDGDTYDAAANPAYHAACEARTTVDIAQVYGQAIAAGAKAEVQLFDRHGSLLDSEVAYDGGGRVPVNQSAGTSGLDLVIDGLDDGELSVVVGSAMNGNSCPNGAMSAQITLWQDGNLLQVVDPDEAVTAGNLVRPLQMAAANDDTSDQSGTTSAANASSHETPAIEVQRAYLEALLRATGWTYTIVTDGDSFARELRSGGYVAYALLDGKVKLAEQVQHELREAVNRGEGLLVAGTHDQRDGRLREALGIEYRGQLESADGVAFDDSPLDLSGELNFVTDGKAIRIDTDGAQAAARFTGPGTQSSGCSTTTVGVQCTASEAAVTYRTYGQGHAVFAGFDLLAQATAAGRGTLYDQLLTSSLTYLQPQPLPIQANGVIPVRVALTNQGMAVDTELAVSAPMGGDIFAAKGATVSAGAAVWDFPLPVDAEASFDVWLRLPSVVGPSSVDALIRTAANSGYTDYATLSLPLDVTGDAMRQLQTALVGASGLDDVRTKVTSAARYVAAGNAAKALQALVDAADALIRAGTSQAEAMRLQVDAAIREVSMSVGPQSH